MDVSKFKFTVNVKYDCDEGQGCYKCLEDGTYEEAVKLFESLDSRTWISGYYHYMSVNIEVYDLHDNQIDLSDVLEGEFEWLSDYYSTSDKNEACAIPADVLRFLEALKKGDNWLNESKIVELETRIKNLEQEIVEAKKELEELKGKRK